MLEVQTFFSERAVISSFSGRIMKPCSDSRVEQTCVVFGPACRSNFNTSCTLIPVESTHILFPRARTARPVRKYCYDATFRFKSERVGETHRISGKWRSPLDREDNCKHSTYERKRNCQHTRRLRYTACDICGSGDMFAIVWSWWCV